MMRPALCIFRLAADAGRSEGRGRRGRLCPIAIICVMQCSAAALFLSAVLAQHHGLQLSLRSITYLQLSLRSITCRPLTWTDGIIRLR